MKLVQHVLPLSLSLSVLGGCPDLTPLDDDPARVEPEPDPDPTTPLTADIDVDTNRDGTIDGDDDAREDVFDAQGGAVFFANVDDDDNDGNRDSRDEVVGSDSDLEDMTAARVRGVLELTDAHVVTLTMEPREALERVRIWRRTGAGRENLVALFEPIAVLNGADPVDTVELTDAGNDIDLLIEALVPRTIEWDGSLTLTVAVKNAETDVVISSDVVALRASPVIFPSNLQRPRTVFVMDVPDGYDNNLAFVGAMAEAMPEGTDLYTLDADEYFYDRWVQDNMELGYQMKPGEDGAGPVEMLTAMQLQRGRGLEAFVPVELLRPSSGFLYPGGQQTSHNYGGNLEVSPPVDGFPLGRMLYGGGRGGTLTGRQSSDTMNEDQVGFLNAQEVQGPALQLSSEWLAVGHIDEIFQFVPVLDPAPGEKSFKVVVASPALAREALLAVQSRGNGALTVFTGRDAEYSVDEIIAAPNFNALNDAGQARIDGVVELMKSELGLVDDDFRPVPVFVEDVGGGYVAAFNPGIQNLVTVGDRVFVPDPEGPVENGVDQWQEATRAALADTGLDVIFVDVFFSYHRQMGEAHCGTNVDREPLDTLWWTE